MRSSLPPQSKMIDGHALEHASAEMRNNEATEALIQDRSTMMDFIGGLLNDYGEMTEEALLNLYLERIEAFVDTEKVLEEQLRLFVAAVAQLADEDRVYVWRQSHDNSRPELRIISTRAERHEHE